MEQSERKFTPQGAVKTVEISLMRKSGRVWAPGALCLAVNQLVVHQDDEPANEAASVSLRLEQNS